jgi:hypothetical protein
MSIPEYIKFPNQKREGTRSNIFLFGWYENNFIIIGKIMVLVSVTRFWNKDNVKIIIIKLLKL